MENVPLLYHLNTLARKLVCVFERFVLRNLGFLNLQFCHPRTTMYFFASDEFITNIRLYMRNNCMHMETKTSGWLRWHALHALLRNVVWSSIQPLWDHMNVLNRCQCGNLIHVGHGSSKSRALSFVMCKFVVEIILFGKVNLPNVVSERRAKRSGGLKSLQNDILSR